MTAGSTSTQIEAGQTASFVATVKNAGTGTDSIDLVLSVAVMEGWSAKMVVDGADQGVGPMTISLSKNGTKTVTVKITARADAPAGEVGEAYLSGTSKKSPAATDSIAFTVTVKE